MPMSEKVATSLPDAQTGLPLKGDLSGEWELWDVVEELELSDLLR